MSIQLLFAAGLFVASAAAAQAGQTLRHREAPAPVAASSWFALAERPVAPERSSDAFTSASSSQGVTRTLGY